MKLKEFFENNPRVALGFSGGVDSSYLLYAALKYGAEVGAYFVKTQFQPQFELDDARRLAEELGAELKVLEHDALCHEEVVKNPENRCYYCKCAIFGMIAARAAADGFPLLVDGTNASDQEDDRPGMQALRELEVRSPLRECGITKPELRRLSKDAGLFTWNKPAYACLATRIPTGEEITAEKLQLVEKSEDALFKLGFSDLRVRLRGKNARIELSREQLSSARACWEEILDGLDCFEEIELCERTG
jgi:TIGR00268 family protein